MRTVAVQAGISAAAVGIAPEEAAAVVEHCGDGGGGALGAAAVALVGS